MSGNPVVEVSDVTVTYGGRRVLDHVSFEIGAGEFTGLIGSNGAGKTTLLQVIVGLVRPDAGRVRVDGVVRTRGHSSFGYVPQKVALDPDVPLRARDFVTLGLDGHRFGVARRSREQRDAVERALIDVDADGFADRPVGRLSGGEQQRVLIAHALVARPSLLVLDEPLANLDPRSVQEIVALLSRVARQHHVAVLISAHDMNAMLPVMNRIVYVTDGHVASGPTDEVVRSEVLSRLYGHHVDVVHLHGRVLVVAEPDERSDHLGDHPPLTLS